MNDTAKKLQGLLNEKEVMSNTNDHVIIPALEMTPKRIHPLTTPNMKDIWNLPSTSFGLLGANNQQSILQTVQGEDWHSVRIDTVRRTLCFVCVCV